MTKRLLFTDRSRIDLHHRCPQARYLSYNWDGTGIRKDTVVWDIVIGIAVHEGLSYLLDRFKDSVLQPPNFGAIGIENVVAGAVDTALARLDKELSSTPFDLSEFSTESSEPAPSNLYLPAPGKESVDKYLSYLIDETKALIELLIRAYAYGPAGLKWLLDTYEVLEVEQEDEFTLIDNDEFEVKFMARADGLLRRRVDGALVVLSFKTTKVWDRRKEESAASDIQGISEPFAIEKRLGKQIEGVQMVYLLTSESRKNYAGRKERSGGLLRPWIKRGGGMLGDEYSFTASWIDDEGKSRRLGKDWARINAWELPGGIAEYVDTLKDSYDEALKSNPLDSIIIVPMLNRREPDKAARWLAEVEAQETRVAQGLLAGESAMAATFPHHSNACAYPTRCQFFELCWGSRYVAEAPLSSGFKRRIPHHPSELEA